MVTRAPGSGSTSTAPHPVGGPVPNFADGGVSITRRAKKPQKTSSCGIRFFRFIRIGCQNGCSMIHFSTNQMQIKSNEKNIDGVSLKQNLVKMDLNNFRREKTNCAAPTAAKKNEKSKKNQAFFPFYFSQRRYEDVFGCSLKAIFLK